VNKNWFWQKGVIMSYIILYADDYDWDVWEQYCEICGVSKDASCIRINFDKKNVEAGV
jgi:hypothetical protein